VAAPDRTSAAVAWLPLVLIVLVAFVARFAALGGEGLWCDEGYTAWIVNRPIPEMLRALQRLDDAPPLFYLLTRGTTALAGRSEFALRLLPALAGVVAIAGLLHRARGRREPASLWAAAFLAVAAYGIFHARQARSYGLVFLLALVAVLGARDLLLRPTRRAGLGVVVGGSLLVLTHNLGILVCLTSVLLWPLRLRPGLSWRRWLLWHAPPLLLWALYAALSLSQFRVHAEGNAWMGEFWRSHPLLLAPLYSLGAFLPGALPRLTHAVPFPTLGTDATGTHLISAVIAVVMLAAAFLPGLRLGRSALAAGEAGTAAERRGATIEAAFWLLPLGTMLLVSLGWSPSYVLSRTDAIAYVPFALWLGRGLSHVPRGAAWAAVAFWTVVSISLLAPTYGLGAPERAKGADREVARAMLGKGLQASDWVVHSYLTAPTLEYYLERAGAAHHVAWYPSDAATNPAAVRAVPADSLEACVRDARALRERFEAAMPPEASVWILAVVDQSAAPGASGLSAGDLAYPTGILVYHLIGNRPVAPVLAYRQDWVSGERVLLRFPRGTWVPVESLGPVRIEDASGAAAR
jgi:hypothetical protein